MIKIVCVGKLKEQYWEDACGEYLKRLTRFGKIQIIELQEQKIAKINQSEIVQALEKEGVEMTKYLGGAKTVVLDSAGEQITSEDLAKYIKENLSSNINFVIGSSHGLSDSIKKNADKVISFGSVTYPHQLIRVMLLEQIYRAFTIINNYPYHK